MRRIYVEPFLYDVEEAIELAKKYDLGLELYISAEKVDLFLAQGIPKELLSVPDLSIHGPIHDIAVGSSDKLIREASIERIRKSLELVSRNLNPNWFLIHMGLNPLTYWSEKLVSDWIERAASALNIVLSDFSHVTIHIENAYEKEPHHLKNFIEKIDHNKIFVTLDIGHAKVYSNKDPEEWIRILAPYIREVHVHNNDGKFDAHKPIEEGVIDYEKMLSLLEDEVGEFIITLEPIDEENLKKDLRWLEERF